MKLADLGEVAKDADHPYYGSELEAADKRRLAERQRVHDINQAQAKHQQNLDAEAIRRKAEYQRTRAQNPATPPTHPVSSGARGPVDDSLVPTGDHRTASRGMSNEQWKQHLTGTHEGGNAPTHTAGGQPTGAAGHAEVERIRANRATDEAAQAAHIASGNKGHMPVPEHAPIAVKEGAGKYKAPKFKMPKGTKRGAAAVTGLAGLGALATSASKKNSKYG